MALERMNSCFLFVYTCSTEAEDERINQNEIETSRSFSYHSKARYCQR